MQGSLPRCSAGNDATGNGQCYYGSHIKIVNKGKNILNGYGLKKRVDVIDCETSAIGALPR
jgi:hypothetical protein